MFCKFSRIIALSVLVLTVCSFSKDALSNYDNHKSLYTSSKLNPFYLGPIFSTGAAMKEINRYIADMSPENIGKFESNNLTLIDTVNQVFSFKKVKSYKVSQKGESFPILYMKSTLNNEKYELIVEIKEGSNYDRIIKIFKDGVQITMILCVDNNNIIQKKAPTNI